MDDILKKLDLGLLRALDMLLKERHVSRAADRLGLSQPATSRALARLRDLFGDPLLVRGRGGMMLTERAEAIVPALQLLFDQLGRLMEAGTFDPAVSTRTFSVRATHYVMQTYLPEVAQRFRVLAPRARLYIDDIKVHDLEQETGPASDLVIAGPDIVRPDSYMSRKLGEDRFVCVMAADHPLAGRTLTLDDYLAYPHCMVSMGGVAGTKVDEALARLGRAREVKLVLPNTLAAFEMLKGSDFLITGAGNQVRRFAGPFGLVWQDLPFPHLPFVYHLVWHPLHQASPAHRWFRELVFGHMQAALG